MSDVKAAGAPQFGGRAHGSKPGEGTHGGPAAGRQAQVDLPGKAESLRQALAKQAPPEGTGAHSTLLLLDSTAFRGASLSDQRHIISDAEKFLSGQHSNTHGHTPGGAASGPGFMRVRPVEVTQVSATEVQQKEERMVLAHQRADSAIASLKTPESNFGARKSELIANLRASYPMAGDAAFSTLESTQVPDKLNVLTYKFIFSQLG